MEEKEYSAADIAIDFIRVILQTIFYVTVGGIFIIATIWSPAAVLGLFFFIVIIAFMESHL
jgi:hypothetical protein